MRKIMTAVLCFMFVAASYGLSLSAEQDVNGSKDHPLLSRMTGFHISGYKDNDFAAYNFIGRDAKKLPVEGHFYYMQYNLDKGAPEPGELKIRRNIQSALQKIGAEVVFDDNFNKTSTIVLKKDGRETWVEVRSYNNMYRLTIVEKEGMEQVVVANAEAMGRDMDATGHVSVYGIYFDTAKSEIKPESDAAISEIAKLLNDDGALNVYIVGHTDNAGSFDSNMKLSKDRALAVVKALTGKHGIASGRLTAHGVASLSPVASNDTEEGRARNRRVELVKQ